MKNKQLGSFCFRLSSMRAFCKSILDRRHSCNFLSQSCRACFLARQSRKCDTASRASF